MYDNNWKLEAETTGNISKSRKTEKQYAATILEKLNMKTSGSGDGLDSSDSNQWINEKFCSIIIYTLDKAYTANRANNKLSLNLLEYA